MNFPLNRKTIFNAVSSLIKLLLISKLDNSKEIVNNIKNIDVVLKKTNLNISYIIISVCFCDKKKKVHPKTVVKVNDIIQIKLLDWLLF